MLINAGIVRRFAHLKYFHPGLVFRRPDPTGNGAKRRKLNFLTTAVLKISIIMLIADLSQNYWPRISAVEINLVPFLASAPFTTSTRHLSEASSRAFCVRRSVKIQRSRFLNQDAITTWFSAERLSAYNVFMASGPVGITT